MSPDRFGNLRRRNLFSISTSDRLGTEKVSIFTKLISLLLSHLLMRLPKKHRRQKKLKRVARRLPNPRKK